MKDKVVIDSYALLAYLKKEGNYSRIKELFKSDTLQVLINEIEIGRTFYIIAQERGMEKAEYFLNTIVPTLPVKKVENTFDDCMAAARVKAHEQLSYLSSLTVITAMKESALLVSGNPEYKVVEKLIKYEPLENLTSE
jgi:predicted nucleic acid-binding protein